MAAPLRGTVINVHALGATVRLDDGTLAAVPFPELAVRRLLYVRSLENREPLDLEIASDGDGRHRTVRAAGAEAGQERAAAEPRPAAEAVSLTDDAFEARMADYLRATQEWAPPDRPQPFERHFLRKKRRAAYFNGPGT